MRYVALSGGADSVCLLLKTLKQYGECTALHCNFHLRGAESDRDENFCRQLCAKLHVPIKVKDFDTQTYAKTHHMSIEMAARELRYAWFAEETDSILVAHHKDDHVETILMNLLRGTGLKGLMGIAQESIMDIKGHKLHILRPLLSMSRADIIKYLNEQGQEYVTDSTNMERDALRNRIRLDLLPLMESLNPQVREHLQQLSENIRSESEGWQQAALFHLLSPLGFNRTQIVEIAAYDGTETRRWHSSTHMLIKSRGEIAFEQVAERSKDVFRVDADKVGAHLLYRRVRKDDRFRPFGMKRGTKRVCDYLREHGVNLIERTKTIVAHTPDGRIVWVVDHEIDDRFCVDDTTQNVMTLTFS